MFGKASPVVVYSFSKPLSLEDASAFKNLSVSMEFAKENIVEEHYGFCNPGDLSSSDVLTANGSYLVTGVVSYARTVPAKAVRFEMDEWIAEQKARGILKIGRKDRSEMKDIIKDRLLTTVGIQPTVAPVVIDPVKNLLYFFSKSKKLIDHLENLFLRMDIDLVEETFFSSLCNDEDDQLIDPVDFGPRFLTWLWYATETDSFKTYHVTEKEFSITPDSCIQVIDATGDTCFVSGDVREAKNGVFNGKLVRRFGFDLLCKDWEFAIPCIVSSDGTLSRIEFGHLYDDEVYNELFNAIECTEYVRAFLSAAVSEFYSIYNDETKLDVLKKEIWNWSRGDVCVRAFEDI